MTDRVSLDETHPVYSIRAVERVIDVFDVLRVRRRGASLAEIARATGLARSSAFRYLTTLERRGYVERDGSDGYRFGPAFPAPARQRDLATVGRPLLEELR